MAVRGAIMDTSNRKQGLALAAAGLCVVVLAVLLFGLTTATGAIDVVSVITAVAGGLMVVSGLLQAYHHPRPNPSV
jgi:phosphatidylserine synthase